MPSASKTDKNAPSDASDPLRQAIVTIEHKIRNLEKRKGKLDAYKESGKPLSRDLLEAVSKYDEVVHQLDMSREYVKQFTAICNENDKIRKKAAKKEALERTATEVSKIKQVLLIQDVLTNMGTDQAREDFLAGRNGAPALTEEDLKYLDDLYVEVSPKHEGSVPFATQVQKAAEFLLAIVDGKSKEVAGTTCVKLQGIVNSIQECGYFDQPAPGLVEAEPEVEEVAQEYTKEAVVSEDLSAPVASHVNNISIPQQAPTQEVPITMAQTAGLSSTIPKPMHPLSNIVPVSQVESNMFNAQGFKLPNASQPAVIPPNQRPINDVMSRVGGNFTFFQDSELELADVVAPGGSQPGPNAIPSRTFTNQSFNGRPAAAPMGFPPAPGPSPYFVGGFPPQPPPHFTQELMQGFGVGQQGVPQTAPVANNVIPPMQTQIPPTGDGSNLGYSQQPQHNANAYTAASNPQTAAQPAGTTPQSFPPVAKSSEEQLTKVLSEVKEEEPPRQDWATDRIDWSTDRNETEWSEWNPQGTDNSTKGSSKTRGDRPRNNYHGTKNGSGGPRTSNYNNNNRPPRNRENNGSNGGSNYYSNNTNGYQSRGDGQSRDNRDNKDGSYKRGPAPNRGPRPDRGDSRGERPPPRDGAPRNNNGGPRPQRNPFRGPRQESNPVK